jgi:type I restriction enzyme S subunit
MTFPPSWVTKKVAESIQNISLFGRKLPVRDYLESGKFPVIDQGQKFIGGFTNDKDNVIVCPSPVIIFGDHTKIIKYVDFDFVPGADGIKVIKPLDFFNPKLFYYFLQAVELPDKGYARHYQYLSKSLIPLPPLPEQERIVERIESIFTQLDAGVADLKRTQVALKRYKASVLKLACEGKLVPQNPSDELAEGILRLKGRSPLVDDYLPSLPNGWCWVTVEQIVSSEPGSIQSGPFGSDLHHSEFQDTGVLAIGIDNVRDGSFSLGKQHMISIEKYNQLQKFTARPFDVLITVMATVGRCCVTPSNIGTAIITKHVYRLSVEKTLVSPYYLMYNLLGGEEVRKQIFSQVRGQTRPGINGTILRSISIPLAPLEEQQRIVVELESRLSVIQEVEQTIETNLKRARRLRQSIIKCAFEGRLV